ncbi:MAG: hypothetical protein AVDCRST_MAG28-953 [uncultured Rubrobacteraceae bacterium]|uniref:Uncharacterized protein n=1 Tax=uncultured Rubrobacteraceae bacterium TaxID=349277 RepID=A0A6J4QJV6_9ACTN|nr:MAG: hypothetical protein AVDCRST_MAG28-953 [uncultured Rubrobacteraceae bacterium]
MSTIPPKKEGLRLQHTALDCVGLIILASGVALAGIGIM